MVNLLNFETKKPRKQETKKPRNQITKQLRNSETKKPRRQETFSFSFKGIPHRSTYQFPHQTTPYNCVSSFNWQFAIFHFVFYWRDWSHIQYKLSIKMIFPTIEITYSRSATMQERSSGFPGTRLFQTFRTFRYSICWNF